MNRAGSLGGGLSHSCPCLLRGDRPHSLWILLASRQFPFLQNILSFWGTLVLLASSPPFSLSRCHNPVPLRHNPVLPVLYLYHSRIFSPAPFLYLYSSSSCWLIVLFHLGLFLCLYLSSSLFYVSWEMVSERVSF